MRIAVLGAGFAGLAVTWYLLYYTRGSISVDLYDPEPIAGGASGISSGLLHPYAGKQAKRSWAATRCMKETHRLITEASRAIGSPIVISKGILRPALTDQQIADFQLCAQQNADTEWWDHQKCVSKIENLRLPEHGGGLFIKEGLTLDVKKYLQGLWQACTLMGTQYFQQGMISSHDLAVYDRILIAIGPLAKNFPFLKDLPIEAVKGQILELKWPSGVKAPPFSLISQKYIVMKGDHHSCFVGSTYEHRFDSPTPDPQKAYQDLMPQIISFFPSLEGAEVLNCNAAFRASSYNHLPLVGKVSDKFYFLTGLGSKGLLYHAWIGKRVARALLTGREDHFPEEVHYTLS